jgi:copper(I)-binding protein
VSAAGSRTSAADVRRDAAARPSRRRRFVLVAAAVAVLVPLSGCAAGIQAETSRERPTVDGIGSAIGTLTIRNAYVGGPAETGGSAPVLLSVFNGGNDPDRLVGISSPVAGSVTLPPALDLPPGGQILLYTADRTVHLNGLTMPVRIGQIVPVVLTFERAGELRMTLPVSPVAPEVLAGASTQATATPGPTPSGSALPSATPTGASSAQPSAGAAASASASPYSGVSAAP